MKQIQMTKKELKRIYDLNLPSYELICKFGKELAERALRNEKVDLLHISSRVKSFESFFEKISRKKYPDPYGQIEDMCGVRIICFYSTDLDRVNKVIEGAFHLKEFIDKLDIQDADRFGYRSNHHIVRLPNLPEFSKFNEFKIEVQSRTVLMHAWAHIQGKLEYKEAEHTPKEFKRKLYQLSAILELADEQFQVLKFEKDALRKQLSAQDFKFSSSTEMNIDTFMSFLEVHFSSREKSYRYSKLLMKELLAHGIGFKEIIESYDKVLIHLLGFEQQLGLSLTQEEALRILLCLNNQSIFTFMEAHPLINENFELINKWREIINH